MDFKIYNGDLNDPWKTINTAKIYDGSNWQTVLEGHVYDGNAWHQFYTAGEIGRAHV